MPTAPHFAAPPCRLLRRVLHETAGVRQESLARLGRMTRSGPLLHRASHSSLGADGSSSPASPLARAGSVVRAALARPSRTVGGAQDQHLAEGGALPPQQAAAAQLASRQASLVRPALLRDPRAFLSRGLSRLSMVRGQRSRQPRAAPQQQQFAVGAAGLAGLARMSAPPAVACPVPEAGCTPGCGSEAV